MIDHSRVPNAFEFVTIASARAKQLMKGCTPRVEGGEKSVRIAQHEVASGVVERLPEEPKAVR